MKKTFLCALLFSTAANAQTQTAADFMRQANGNRPKQGVVYTMTVSGDDGVISYDVSQKGDKWKMESKNAALPATVLFDGRQVTVSVMGMAVKDKNAPNYAALPMDDETFVLGEETVKNGVSCRMMSDAKGTQICVSEQFGLPVYTKTENMQVDMKNIRAAALDDSVFILPAKTQIVDMNDMFFGR
ncbi:MAG TPA: hypothetical protein DD624_05900 [Alphaproteobacteria bacterium]|nr:hypothetical protein [Alphaproteobacteria bacterium]